jgi:hypothetical protein
MMQTLIQGVEMALINSTVQYRRYLMRCLPGDAAAHAADDTIASAHRAVRARSNIAAPGDDGAVRPNASRPIDTLGTDHSGGGGGKNEAGHGIGERDCNQSGRETENSFAHGSIT